MTNVEEIYNVFLSSIDDEMLALLKNSNLRKLLHTYLLGAIFGFKKCKKDLTIKDYYSHEFKLEMGDDELLIPENIIYKDIEVVGTETGEIYKKDIEYSINDETNKLEFNYPIQEPVIIYMYNNGYFEVDLTNEEIQILGMGMICYWTNIKVNREENLTQIISDGDYKRLSGANMLDKLLKLKERNDENFRLATINYSYNQFKGFS